MKICRLFVLTIFITLICNLKGQKPTRKMQPKFNRFFGNISRECLKEHRVTPERILGVYTLNINDRDAKCYVACMLSRFNVTTRNGSYNDKALEQLMARPNSNNEIPTSMKAAIAICEKQVDRDLCEKAVKFTKCIYAHKDEFIVKKKENSPTPTADRRWPFSAQENVLYAAQPYYESLNITVLNIILFILA